MKLVWTDKGKKYKGDKILMQISHSYDFEHCPTTEWEVVNFWEGTWFTNERAIICTIDRDHHFFLKMSKLFKYLDLGFIEVIS